MSDQVTITPTAPLARPVILYVSDKDYLPKWMIGPSLHESFIIVQAYDLPGAVDLARTCRPDLLLSPVGSKGHLSLCSDQWQPSQPLSRRPIIQVQMEDDPCWSSTSLDRNVEDVLSAHLSSQIAAIRLRAVLRRRSPTVLMDRVFWKTVELRHDERIVLIAGQTTHLKLREFNLLALLMEAPGRKWSREELQQIVWGPQVQIGPKAINNLAQSVRRQMTPLIGYDPIEAVRGGYRLV